MEIEKQLTEKGLVQITTIPLDLRYTTKNNFTKRKLYKSPLCFLRKEAAESLLKAQNELESRGLTFVIWDAYRPLSIQKILLRHFPDTDFVAEISDHNRGIAVDLTIADKDLNLLEMPSDFDSFSKYASHSCKSLPVKILENRKLLKDIMQKYGFEPYEKEWWHYTFAKLKGSGVLDIII